MIDAFAKDGFEVYAGSDEFVQKILAAGGAGCITAAANLNSRFGAIVYAKREGRKRTPPKRPHRDPRAAVSVPLIPGLREIMARSTVTPPGAPSARRICRLAQRRATRSGRRCRPPAPCAPRLAASKAAAE